MSRLCTWAAARDVLDGMSGIGNEGDLALAPHATRMAESPDYAALVNCIENVPLRDPDEWVQTLYTSCPSVGLRVLKMREEYLLNRLDWSRIQELTVDMVTDGNLRLTVSHLEASTGLRTEDFGEGEDTRNNERR